MPIIPDEIAVPGVCEEDNDDFDKICDDHCQNNCKLDFGFCNTYGNDSTVYCYCQFFFGGKLTPNKK